MQFVSWQAVIAAVLVLMAVLLSTDIRLSFSYGCLAVIVPNLAITLGMSRAGAAMSVLYSMSRWLIISCSMVLVFMLLKPGAAGFLAGASAGIATVVFVPIIVEIWNHKFQPNLSKGKGLT